MIANPDLSPAHNAHGCPKRRVPGYCSVQQAGGTGYFRGDPSSKSRGTATSLNPHASNASPTLCLRCSDSASRKGREQRPSRCYSVALPALTGRFAELLLTVCTPLYTPHAPVLAAGADAWSQRDRAGSRRRLEVQRAESRQQGGSGRSDLHLQHWQLGIRILRLVILQCTDGLRCHSDASAVASVTAIASILTPDTADVATATTAGAW